MTISPLEVYKEFLLRVNKNDTNKNISVPKGEFVLLFNEQAPLWLDKFIDDNLSTDSIEDVAEMYQPDTELVKLADKELFSQFTLPSNFLKKAAVYLTATKGECKDVVMVAWDFKPKNKNFTIQNANLTPSFEYQETNYALAGNTLILYKSDFTIDKAYLSYYRKPTQLDLKGYKHLDGTESSDASTDLDDINVYKVLNVCAEIALGRYQNIEGTQIAANVVAKEK